MTVSPTAVRTARRNLVLRIERFVRRIEIEGLQPNVDAMANLAIALECLEREDHPTGEDAMMLAERGWAPRLPATAETRPIAELLETLKRLRAEG